MIKPPQHPVGSAFDQARDRAFELERALTEVQRQSFDDLKNKQSIERRQQQERLDSFKAQFEEQQKKRKQKSELALNPPIRVRDPYIDRQIQNIIAAENRLEKLDKAHLEERVKALEKFAEEREQRKTIVKTDPQRWQDALRKAGEHEKDRSRPRDLTDDFDKAR